MSFHGTDAANDGSTGVIIARKFGLVEGIKMKNVLFCLKYFMGSVLCFAAVGLYFKFLGFTALFIGLFGVILLERGIFVVLGMRTR